MDEIKFRSAHYNFDGTFNGFSYWGAIDRFGNIETTSEGFASPTSRSGTERKFEEQYTGLKDRNGKEIYEGDILHFKTYDGGGFAKVGINCYAEVVFGNHNLTDDSLYRSQGFYILTGKSHHATSIYYWLNSHKAIVIGNIHENPELCKQS